MIEKINELQKLLLGKEIKHKTAVGFKFYNVKSIVERNSKIVVETKELKTFTESLETIDAFMNSIELVGVSEIIVKEALEISNKETKESRLPLKPLAFVAPESTKNVSDGLMSIFNNLVSKTDVSDAELKHAKTVCDIAGKIIDCERVKLGYLTLNYR